MESRPGLHPMSRLPRPLPSEHLATTIYGRRYRRCGDPAHPAEARTEPGAPRSTGRGSTNQAPLTTPETLVPFVGGQDWRFGRLYFSEPRTNCQGLAA